MPFTKGHAYGNDFLCVDARHVSHARLDVLAREMCERHTGIGADGLMVYDDDDGQQARMKLFNADGGVAEVSGNGVRVLAALLLREAGSVHAEVTIDTEGGAKRLCRTGIDRGRQVFRAAMGLPRDLCQVLLAIDGERLTLTTMNFGNPQCVILGPLPDEARFARLGAALERHSHFPQGTNVEFASVEAPDRVRILIWERGVGPTSSSGTGSCASLVAAAAFGGAARSAEVMAPGGPQRVEWESDHVYLTGWAELVCDGRWSRALPL